MEQIVFYFNCHATPIINHLNKSKKVNERYQISHININNYLAPNKYSGKLDFIEEDKSLIENADMLVCIYIRNNRGFLNHTNVISLCKKESCKIIIMPHYTFSGYFYYDHIINLLEGINEADIKIYNEKITHILSKTDIDPDKFEIFLKNEMEDLSYSDKFSDIKVYDFVQQNFIKERLWSARAYPTSRFFHFVAEQILLKLQINETIEFVNCHFGEHLSVPILDTVKNLLGLEFEPKMFYYCKHAIVTKDYYLPNEFYCIRKYLGISPKDIPELYVACEPRINEVLGIVRKHLAK